jgi:hypothetical protein
MDGHGETSITPYNFIARGIKIVERGKIRRMPFIFDDLHFCRVRVIGLDMTENRIFTLSRMIN